MTPSVMQIRNRIWNTNMLALTLTYFGLFLFFLSHNSFLILIHLEASITLCWVTPQYFFTVFRQICSKQFRPLLKYRIFGCCFERVKIPIFWLQTVKKFFQYFWKTVIDSVLRNLEIIPGVVSKGTWVSYYQASVTITLGRRV